MWFRAVSSIFFTLLLTPSAEGESLARNLALKADTAVLAKTSQSAMQVLLKAPNYTRLLKIRTWQKEQSMTMYIRELTPSGYRKSVWIRNGNLVQSQAENQAPFSSTSSSWSEQWEDTQITLGEIFGVQTLNDEFLHQILRQERKHVLIESRPKTGVLTPFHRVLFWTRQRDGLPMQKRFFNEADEPIRTVDYTRFRRMDSQLVPTQITISTPENKQTTLIRIERILFDRFLPQLIFDESSLTALLKSDPEPDEFWFYPTLEAKQSAIATKLSPPRASADPDQTP